LIQQGLDVRIAGMELSERDRAILDFEGSWWAEEGSKEAAIRARFGLSSARYYQIVGALCARVDAREYSPLVVRRLQRDRERRRRARYEGTPAHRRHQP
jgi:Protein of unknown function (DUF3263)